MVNNNKNPAEKDRNIENYRKEKKGKISKLGDYKHDYNLDKFILDLKMYFEDEVDFNIEKIHKILEEPGKLDQLIKKAEKRNTHPVTEFVQELFKDLGSSGDIPWEP